MMQLISESKAHYNPSPRWFSFMNLFYRSHYRTINKS